MGTHNAGHQQGRLGRQWDQPHMAGVELHVHQHIAKVGVAADAQVAEVELQARAGRWRKQGGAGG